MRILIFRSGAFGDNLIITPVLRYLHQQGHELVVVSNERGSQVFKNNPHIKTYIEQPTDSVKIEALGDHIKWLQKKHRCDRVIDFSESIEVALSQHPRGPNYKLPKAERLARFNRNFYEYSFEWAKEAPNWWTTDKQTNAKFYNPELFLEPSEIKEAKSHLKEGYFNILIGMSGSGTNKTWPHTEELCFKIANEIPEAHMITVGDVRSTLIEPQIVDRITNLCDKTSMRVSMALTGVVNLVIAPDTGLLHASGCYDTPKIGLLGHNTKECITKYFINDHSIESDPVRAECSPCLYLVYNKNLQCVTDEEYGGASLCMSRGIEMEKVFNKVKELYLVSKGR